jgi:hypothetical protein
VSPLPQSSPRQTLSATTQFPIWRNRSLPAIAQWNQGFERKLSVPVAFTAGAAESEPCRRDFSLSQFGWSGTEELVQAARQTRWAIFWTIFDVVFEFQIDMHYQPSSSDNSSIASTMVTQPLIRRWLGSSQLQSSMKLPNPSSAQAAEIVGSRSFRWPVFICKLCSGHTSLVLFVDFSNVYKCGTEPESLHACQRMDSFSFN